VQANTLSSGDGPHGGATKFNTFLRSGTKDLHGSASGNRSHRVDGQTFSPTVAGQRFRAARLRIYGG